MALEIGLKDSSDKPWSLKGWTFVYKQIGPVTFAYKLKAPDGTLYHDPYGGRGNWYEYRGASTIEDVIQKVVQNNRHELVIQSYLKKTLEESEYTL